MSTSNPITIVGRSSLIDSVVRRAEDAARSGDNILLTGEAGTGKSLLASFIHCVGPASTGGVRSVDFSTARPRSGLLDSDPHEYFLQLMADHDGTLLLEEIGDLWQAERNALYLILRGRGIPSTSDHFRGGVKRIIMTSSVDLAPSWEGLNVDGHVRGGWAAVRIHIPPLRERAADIPSLLSHFVQRYSPGNALYLTHQARDILQRYSWPGNVRELRSLVLRLLTSGIDMIGLGQLPVEMLAAVRDVIAGRVSPHDGEVLRGE